jgi:antitoxin Phd
MAKTWQLQEAKNSLSKVVDLAQTEGPQTVTRHGRPVAVIVSQEDFERRRASQRTHGSLVSFLQGLSFGDAELDVRRERDLDRELKI